MKKWYLICGILALLLVISIGTCSNNSSKLDRLKDELTTVKAELSELQTSYDKLLYEYNKLQGKIPAAPQENKIETLVFNGLTVSLIDYHWDKDDLITTWSFYNNRPHKNESMMIYAYDQDANRICAEWPIMSAPTLWPGETKEKTITWHCGPRSFAITIHLDDLFQGTYTKNELTITRQP